LNPNWDEKFIFAVNNPATDTLCIECWDQDVVGKDDSLGGCKVGLLGLVTGAKYQQMSLDSFLCLLIFSSSFKFALE